MAEENAVQSDGNLFPRVPPPPEGAAHGSGPNPLERLASFRFTYLAIFVFVLLYVFSVEATERLLHRHFETLFSQATSLAPSEGPALPEIQSRVDRLLRRSRWIRWGGVRVSPLVLGSDGRTLIYAGGTPAPPPPSSEGAYATADHWLLPATVDVVLSIPHNALLANGILIAYFAILVSTLLVYTRRLTRREAERLDVVLSSRSEIAARATSIEGELQAVRDRLFKVEPERASQAGGIRELEEERRQLQAKLAEVERRAQELQAGAGDATRALEDERATLEQLLEEALADLGQKDDEIRSLQQQVKKASRGERSSSRTREGEQLGRRLLTLYKNLEIDERAIQDLVGLKEETLKLKAEEALKRLSDESELAAVRRKVGGLPPQLSIFELGFAGKGRIYYTRGRQRRFRILTIGAKNTQNADLEYLSRLPRE